MSKTNWQLDDLPIFIATVEQQGISAAGEHLGIAKSTVSKAINRLEEALEVKLMERNSRNLRLTSEGEAFYRHGLLVMERVEDTSAVMAGLTTEPSGRLVAAMPIAFGREILARHLPRFYKAYPNVDLELLLTSHNVDIIRDPIDLAVVIGALPDSDLVAKPLYKSKLKWVASPEYANAHHLDAANSDIASLQAHIQMVETRYRNPRFAVRAGSEKATINLAQGIAHANDPIVVREAVKAGAGVSLVPDQYCKRGLASGRLVEVFTGIQSESSAATLSVIYPGRRLLASKVRVFLQFLEEVCAEL